MYYFSNSKHETSTYLDNKHSLSDKIPLFEKCFHVIPTCEYLIHFLSVKKQVEKKRFHVKWSLKTSIATLPRVLVFSFPKVDGSAPVWGASSVCHLNIRLTTHFKKLCPICNCLLNVNLPSWISNKYIE